MNVNEMACASSQNTMYAFGTDAQTIRRIVKCRQAMMRAQNVEFRKFWARTAMSLIEAYG